MINSTIIAGLLVMVASTASRILPCNAFHPAMQTSPSSPVDGRRSSQGRSLFKLCLQKGWLDDENDDDDDLVTREDFNRDMLGMEPKVKRKKRKGKGYTPLDNRDHLPFSVRTTTPDDPYKNRYQKEKEQQLQKKRNGVSGKRTDLDRHMLATAKRDVRKNKKRSTNNAKNDRDNSKDSTTPSRLVQRRSDTKTGENDSKSMVTVLGEFELDKSTTSGDVIVLGDKEYRVEKARCQYKYAGGKRFVMVRKILEVKELTRVENEEVLLRQFNLSSSSSSTLYDEPEESE